MSEIKFGLEYWRDEVKKLDPIQARENLLTIGDAAEQNDPEMMQALRERAEQT